MSDPKNRHGCLTAWLALMIVANSAIALVYLVWGEFVESTLPNAPGWALPVLTAGVLINLVCAIALFRWKKWGFWGFCVTSVLALGVNSALGIGVGTTLGGLVSVLLLFGVLHIGKENKGWPQLE